MRIGEIAALVGVSPRAVRHYHQVGLLPEPERLANGYREYRLRDAVALARVRRLTELGLSLENIRAALAGDRKRDLREVLVELDADLARQQDEIRTRRERLAGLLAEAELDHDSTVSPELAGVLRGLPMAGSPIAELDRHLLMLADTAALPADRAHLAELLRSFAEPQAFERGAALYAGIDELAEADPGDPRVAVLAGELAAHLPDEMAKLMIDSLDGAEHGGRLMDTLARELSAAQLEVLRLVLIALKERM